MQQLGTEDKPLFQNRIAIHPRSVKGTFRTFKTAMLVLAYLIYFGLPWLPWIRHDAPSQAVLFDMVGRRFFIFDLVFYPQDLISLSFLLFISAAMLFFVTGLVGRAFCGYFCFQTVWTDAFIFIEKWVQGERPARLRLQKQPWNADKIAKYGMTHGLWLLLSFLTAYSFIMYFGYAPELTQRFFVGGLPSVAYFTVVMLTLTTYAAAGLAREQVCMYMCPYARFQGVMYEPETLAPYYDFQRGEGTAGRAVPRAGSMTREERQAQGIGDCIDCGYCVQVCPTGIDIRNGLQYQCISCGLCTDACDTIMASLGFPKGLVRYDSEINIESKTPGKRHLDWMRLRTLGYGGMILVMIAALIYNIATRSDTELSIQPVRQPLFVEMSNGDIRNRYQIHITNKTQDVQAYRIGVRGVPQEALDLGEIGNEVSVRQGKSVMVLANVRMSPATAGKAKDFEFVITPLSKPGQAISKKVHFYAQHEEHEEHEKTEKHEG
ncbi:MAG TPA: cytochrome c oxidase accessory protein CcoG [Sulfuricella sp.]|nr:cytochrome c oxidase accessory protein CcoG [Sulfuricella sp.]